jgi:hypothetical protein
MQIRFNGTFLKSRSAADKKTGACRNADSPHNISDALHFI